MFLFVSLTPSDFSKNHSKLVCLSTHKCPSSTQSAKSSDKPSSASRCTLTFQIGRHLLTFVYTWTACLWHLDAGGGIPGIQIGIHSLTPSNFVSPLRLAGLHQSLLGHFGSRYHSPGSCGREVPGVLMQSAHCSQAQRHSPHSGSQSSWMFKICYKNRSGNPCHRLPSPGRSSGFCRH